MLLRQQICSIVRLYDHSAGMIEDDL